jgi:hypothetical protein
VYWHSLAVSAATDEAAPLGRNNRRTDMKNNDWLETEVLMLSVPHRGRPEAGVLTRRGIINLAHELSNRGDDVIYLDATPAEMLANFHGWDDEEVEAAMRGDDTEDTIPAEVADLARRHGWETPLYTAYGITRPDEWLPLGDQDPNLIEFEAAVEWLGHDVSYFTIVSSAEEFYAKYAFLRGKSAAHIGQCGSYAAAAALRKESPWPLPLLVDPSDAADDEDDEDKKLDRLHAALRAVESISDALRDLGLRREHEAKIAAEDAALVARIGIDAAAELRARESAAIAAWQRGEISRDKRREICRLVRRERDHILAGTH